VRAALETRGWAVFDLFAGQEGDRKTFTDSLVAEQNKGMRDFVPADQDHQWPDIGVCEHLNAARREESKRGWTPVTGRSFGAPAHPVAFHLPLGTELRLNLHLYRLAASIFGQPQVRFPAAGNRFASNDPGTGDVSLAHFDVNFNAFDPAKETMKLQALFFASPGYFKHADSLYSRDELLEAYPYFANVKGCKTAVRKDKPDPFKFLSAEHQTVTQIPRGHVLVFRADLCHFHSKNPLPFQRRVVYLDLMTPVQDPLSSDERKRLHFSGEAPACYPSGDPVRPLAKKFFNFTKLLDLAGEACADSFSHRQEYGENAHVEGWKWHYYPKKTLDKRVKKPSVLRYTGPFYEPKTTLQELLLWGSEAEWDDWLASAEGRTFWCAPENRCLLLRQGPLRAARPSKRVKLSPISTI
jgi:hypothetical protein